MDFSFLKHVKIRTENFILRDLTLDDATPTYLSWLQNKETQKFIITATDMQELENLRSYVKEKAQAPDTMFLGIFTHDQKHIGNIKYNLEGSAEIYAVMGIMIGDPDFRGKGVAQEILKATGEYLKKHHIKKIYLGVDSTHTQAVRAYEKMGFRICPNSPLSMSGNGHAMVWELI